MNSRQRLNSVMNNIKPDKMPLMCQMSIGFMLKQLQCSPSEFWYDVDNYVNGLIKLRDRFNFDGILISLHGHDENWRSYIKEKKFLNSHEEIIWIDNSKTIFPYNDLPYNIDKVIDRSVLPEVLDYIPVSQDLHFKINQEDKFLSIKKVIEKTHDQFSIHGEITSPLDYFLDFVGTQDGLIEFLLDPERCKTILQHFTDKIVVLSDEMCKTGVDAIKISSPFAGAGFISPEAYQEFVLPYEKQIIDVIHSNNVLTYTHTCGAISDRLELIFNTNTNGLECLDPPPLGDVELEDAFNRVGSKGFIKGNIDSVSILLNGTTDEIIKDVCYRINEGKKRNNFILSTACSIAPDVDPHNILILNDLRESLGFYD